MFYILYYCLFSKGQNLYTQLILIGQVSNMLIQYYSLVLICTRWWSNFMPQMDNLMINWSKNKRRKHWQRSVNKQKSIIHNMMVCCVWFFLFVFFWGCNFKYIFYSWWTYSFQMSIEFKLRGPGLEVYKYIFSCTLAFNLTYKIGKCFTI